MAYFTTSDGLQLHYTDEGAGLPILCLPGLTRTTRDFDYVTPHLDGCRLIKLDARGRGKSDRAPDWRSYVLPVECRDVLELLDHLGLGKVAILGTSRGGLNAMGLAAAAKDRLIGVSLNDVGPVIGVKGLEYIKGYLGRRPSQKTHEEAAKALERAMKSFKDVPLSRWREEVRTHYITTPDGLDITYDPKLRDALLDTEAYETPDLWPYFDALAGLPLACIRGANSDLLKSETFAEMKRRRPDMIAVEVPGRGHIPFLDEPEAVGALHRWIEAMR